MPIVLLLTRLIPFLLPPVAMKYMSQIGEKMGQWIYSIRYLLVPFYMLLWVALSVYLWNYTVEIWHLVTDGNLPKAVLLSIIELTDMTMIAQLIVMTTIGGYSIFVREYGNEIKDRPRWLSSNFSSSEQKIKLGMSLIAVACVNLLPDFLNMSASITWADLSKKVAIVVVFIVSTLAFCIINNLMHPSHPPTPHQEPHHDSQ